MTQINDGSNGAALKKYPWLWATSPFWYPDESTLTDTRGKKELLLLLNVGAQWLGERDGQRLWIYCQDPKGELRVRRINPPQPGEGSWLIKVAEACTCGQKILGVAFYRAIDHHDRLLLVYEFAQPMTAEELMN